MVEKEKKIKEHPEFTNNYPAVDGIGISEFNKRPIRSDIENLLRMDNLYFDSWYKQRKEAAESLLKKYELVGSIPDLQHGPQCKRCGLGKEEVISKTVNVLKKGLEYLEVIRKVRGEYQRLE
jgi:hypothetical protein